MGGIASNDAELAAILAPAVMEGLQIISIKDGTKCGFPSSYIMKTEKIFHLY